jgi:hypothetical protein
MTTPPHVNSILSRRERVSAFEVIEAEGAWGVLLDDFVPDGEQPRAAVFPREQDAREFVAKVKRGLSAEEAIEILWKGTH